MATKFQIRVEVTSSKTGRTEHRDVVSAREDLVKIGAEYFTKKLGGDPSKAVVETVSGTEQVWTCVVEA